MRYKRLLCLLLTVLMLCSLVPETTYAYLSGKAGKNAVARICAAEDVVHH